MERGRALRAVPPGVALSRADARGFRRRRRMLAEGFSTRRGRRGALIHHDAVNHMLRGRRGARLDGADLGRHDPRHRRLPGAARARESVHRHGQRGLRGREPGRRHLPARQRVLSHPARRARHGAGRGRAGRSRRPFRSGSARRRAAATSCRRSVSRLRGEIAARLDAGDSDERAALARRRGRRSPRRSARAARRLSRRRPCRARRAADAATRSCSSASSTRPAACSSSSTRPIGSRLNRAWGLALRKRFCRKFNFELQAAATEDNIVPVADHGAQLRARRRAALPAFGERARRADPGAARRADVHDALALGCRRRAGAAALPRRQEGAAAARAHGTRRTWSPRCFPTSSPAPRISPASARSPTIRWSIRRSRDCLHEAMDIEGLERLLARHRGRRRRGRRPRPDRALAARARGAVGAALRLPRRRAARGAAHPGGDGAPLARPEERRRPRPARSRGDRAGARRGLAGRRTTPTSCTTRCSGSASSPRRDRASRAGLGRMARRAGARAGASRGCSTAGATLWIAAERLPQFQALLAGRDARAADRRAGRLCASARGRAEQALVEIVRGRLEGSARSTADGAGGAARPRPRATIAAALAALEAEGFALRGRFTPGAEDDEWCDRRLLARIHRYTVKRLRAEIEPVAARDFLRFLFDWQHVAPDARMEGPDALAAIVGQLEGLRGAGRAPGRAKSCPRGCTATSRPGSTTLASPGASPGRGCGRAMRGQTSRARREPGAHRRRSLCSRAATRAALDGAVAGARTGAPSQRARAPCRRLPRQRTARRSSTNSSTARGLLRAAGRGSAGRARRARPRRPRTVSPGLRALLAPPSSAAAAGARRRGASPSAWRAPAAGRSSRRAAPAERSAKDASDAASSMSRARCCAAMAWCSGACSRARPRGCRHGAICCASTAGWRRAARFAADASSPASPGEQFALPEAVGALRETRRKAHAGAFVSLSGADPLNLVGILTPGPQAGGADRQPRPLPRRPAGRDALGRERPVPRRGRGRRPMGGGAASHALVASGLIADLV